MIFSILHSMYMSQCFQEVYYKELAHTVMEEGKS